MSWMADLDIILGEARARGIEVDLSDFARDAEGVLTVDGVPFDDWYESIIAD